MRNVFACLILVLGAGAFAAEDVIVLTDGRKIQGEILRETESAVFIKEADGEQRGIAKARIAEIHRSSGQKTLVEVGPEAAPQPGAVPNPPQAADAKNEKGKDLLLPDPEDLDKENQELFAQLKDLGHPRRDERHAALARAKALGIRAMPVLLAMLHPKQKVGDYERIGALRALVELGPLDEQGALTLAYVAMNPYEEYALEVWREACRCIRLLKDDRALTNLIQYAARPDARQRFPAARALREINDDRAFATLINAIPPVAITSSNPNTDASVREVEIPLDGMGTTTTAFLPTSSVSGTATNIDSPMAEAMKVIARKDIGNFQQVWINWLNEKIGTYTRAEREAALRETQSVRDKIGSPSTTRP